MVVINPLVEQAEVVCLSQTFKTGLFCQARHCLYTSKTKHQIILFVFQSTAIYANGITKCKHVTTHTKLKNCWVTAQRTSLLI